MSLVRSWGGVTIAYRKRMVDSPAYRLNHEEVIKALEEGIVFAENLNPIEAVPDERGALKAVIFKRESKDLPAGQDPLITLPARTVLVAAGTTPNITYEKECAGTFQLDAKKKFFQPHSCRRRNGDGRFHVEPDANGFFTSYEPRAGSSPTTATTIRATPATSSRRWRRPRTAFRRSLKLFAKELAALDPAAQPQRDAAWERLCQRLDAEFTAVVEDVVRLTPTIVEVIVKAPAAARHFHPGQFYRLQNYESVTRRVADGGRSVPLLMEGIALTGAWVDKERGLLSLIALELGVSSRLVRVPEEGRAGRRHGTDRHADRDSRRARTCCCSAAASATPCCSRSPRRCATPATG